MALERRCDFHTHTTHSDGTYTPAEVVRLAEKAQISCLAITDHDTVSGVAEAQTEGGHRGIEVISGVEISVQHEPGTLHMLGYFLNCRSNSLLKRMEEIQTARRQRNPKMIEKLNSLGIAITLEEVAQESGGEQVGRPHFAQVMVRKGYVKNFDEAFDKYLTKGGPAYVAKQRLTSAEAIQMIHEPGGLSVLAHPKQLRLDAQPEELDRLIERLKSEGLNGIEAYSSCQSKAEAERYKKIAKRFDLVVTGGSDFHGTNRPDIPLGWVGNGIHLSYEMADQMKKILLDRKMKP